MRIAAAEALAGVMCLVLVTLSHSDPSETLEQVLDTITDDKIVAHVRTLSSDAFGGRAPSTAR